MEWPVDRGLHARMVATLGLMAVVAALGTVAVYAGVRLLLWVGVHVVELSPLAALVAVLGARSVAAATAVLFLLGVTVAEFRLDDAMGLPEVDATPADREAYPRLCGHVDRLAQQFDLPPPAVAVADDPSPLAMTTGLTSTSATLVVSSGLLDALDDDELAAVVAHELAHVRNRDTAVMTLASLPMVVADAAREWATTETEVHDHGRYVSGGGINPVVFPVALAFWFVGRVIVSLLSQYRELAADRAAAVVTGSPAALTSALRTLTDAERPPGRDYRARSAVGAFAIVPEDPPEPIRLGPEGEHEPFFVNLRVALHGFFRTHPPLERRLAELRELQAEVETADGA